MKSIGPTREPTYCKSCFKAFYPSPYRILLEGAPLLCDDCVSSISKEVAFRNFQGTRILFLGYYDGIMKTWLMNYKEKGDVELAPVFLSIYLLWIRLFFPHHLFVPLPSSDERVEKRGFDHLSRILEASKLPYQRMLHKGKSGEQKNNKGAKRFEKKNITLLEGTTSIADKRIVLFDDVLTTGSTFLESKEVLSTLGAKSISGLILLDNERSEERRVKTSLNNMSK